MSDMDVINFYKIYRISMEIKKLILDAHPSKMSALEFFIILHVGRETSGCSQYDLVKSMSLQSSRINLLVRKLVKDELLIESCVHSNRNKMLITTTKKADDIVATVVNATNKKINYIEGNFEEYDARLDFLFKGLID